MEEVKNDVVSDEENKQTDPIDEVEKEEEDNTYIAGDDRTLPVEFDRDISHCDITLRIKSGDYPNFLYQEENKEGTHKSDKVTIFKIPRQETKDIGDGEYTWSVSVNDSKTNTQTSTKPEKFYVVSH